MHFVTDINVIKYISSEQIRQVGSELVDFNVPSNMLLSNLVNVQILEQVRDF